ncbi:MAG TPA: imidazole glycerol phosphate synthase subunit HisH [Allosphingosinicella sp.]|nr:imidazole glycerol phosphate synthase subunit HisH [Allosphingosinicella sp.]
MNLRDRHVGIVDYKAGNVRSIENAIEHLGARIGNIRAPEDIEGFTHIVLPGVGAFGHCTEKLRATGLIPSLVEAVCAGGKPLLGICVGMQLLADFGEELGGHEGLGWIGGQVRALTASPGVRVPHVGWNEVTFQEEFGDFRVGDRADFYFDHSFAYHDPRDGRVIGSCDHGGRFAAIVGRGSITACQFHPEKSQTAGLRFVSNFLRTEPSC